MNKQADPDIAVGFDRPFEPSAEPDVLSAGNDSVNLVRNGEATKDLTVPFSGSVDVKVELPLPALRTPRHQLLPTLDLKASNDPEADLDTIKAGLVSNLIVAQAGQEYYRNSPEKALVKAIAWDNSAKIEGGRDFDNTNFIVSSVFQFPLKLIFLGSPSPKHPFIGLTPFIGFEGSAIVRNVKRNNEE